MVVVTFADLASKVAAIAAGHGALDTPTSPMRPLMTGLVGLVALAGALLLPRLCVPGMLLVAAGVTSNLVSLALWPGVPNPFGFAIAGGILHFNLADTCVSGGGVLFLAATLWTLWRMPDERFAELVGTRPDLRGSVAPAARV